MHVDPFIVLGSAIIGFLVGMTGAGGGALMTPMLILLFGVKPSAAISSDLVAAVRDAPVRRGRAPAARAPSTCSLVRWMVLGSVPMAFLGSFLLQDSATRSRRSTNIQHVLGAALLLGAAAMVLRYVLDRRSGERRARASSTTSSRIRCARRDRHDRRRDRRA